MEIDRFYFQHTRYLHTSRYLRVGCTYINGRNYVYILSIIDLPLVHRGFARVVAGDILVTASAYLLDVWSRSGRYYRNTIPP